MQGIGQATTDGADHLALRLIKMPHAFRAFAGVNLINRQAHANRPIRAFGFAHIAIDTFIGN